MFKHDPDDLKPCPHMETLVSAWLDGALNGLHALVHPAGTSPSARAAPTPSPCCATLKARLRGIADAVRPGADPGAARGRGGRLAARRSV